MTFTLVEKFTARIRFINPFHTNTPNHFSFPVFCGTWSKYIECENWHGKCSSKCWNKLLKYLNVFLLLLASELLLHGELHASFISNAFFANQRQCCFTFSYTELQMLLTCYLLHIRLIILRHFIFKSVCVLVIV